jgi:hypothetical protein
VYTLVAKSKIPCSTRFEYDERNTECTGGTNPRRGAGKQLGEDSVMKLFPIIFENTPFFYGRNI